MAYLMTGIQTAGVGVAGDVTGVVVRVRICSDWETLVIRIFGRNMECDGMPWRLAFGCVVWVLVVNV